MQTETRQLKDLMPQLSVSIQGAPRPTSLSYRSSTAPFTQFAVQEFVLFLQCANFVLKALNMFFEANDLSVFRHVTFV